MKRSVHDDSSVHEAFAKVVDSSQRLLINRIDLLQLDVQDAAERFVKHIALALVGGLCISVAALCLSIALGFLLTEYMPAWGAVAIMGSAYLLLGGGLLGLVNYRKKRAAKPVSVEPWTPHIVESRQKESTEP